MSRTRRPDGWCPSLPTVEIPQHSKSCQCWQSIYSLGHEGHCCFVREDRNRRINNGFRENDAICHVPRMGLDT